MEEMQAIRYLESLIGQTLRVHTTDTRMFVGTFKCTDAERNIILAGTYEYRFPSPSAIRDATANTNNEQIEAKPEPKNVTVDMTSRFIGLVVVPGQHITKIELEETPQQSRLRDTLRKS
ncbi:hypothetical protein Aspvir_001294 [Aspergillus viridinutans]|uniref:Sm domain-containing protein n=1 Tax=Aspergillus viridinutans TaxID=75553 RepID=A0A9P3BV11_ASPVI|nr:uncharacterized protein Aspvir_001294 [Aspergillus viridinutans]GIJ99168.1 hypothetical protein Aspvir_001294 [Aspergillus viridinutans]